MDIPKIILTKIKAFIILIADYEKIIKNDIFQFNFNLGKLFLISNKNNYISISNFISKIKQNLKVFVRNNKNTRIVKNIYILC
jgi:hypothetical protein